MEESVYNLNNFMFGDELTVVLSLLDSNGLHKVKDGLDYLKNEEYYRNKLFPLSCAGLNWVEYTIEYELAYRLGKGIKIVEGKAIMCNSEDSLFWKNDCRNKEVSSQEVDDGRASDEYSGDDLEAGEDAEWI